MKKLSFLPITLALFGAILLMGACSKSSNTKTTTTTLTGTTLYDSLGGTTLVSDPTRSGAKIEAGRLAIRSVIDSTIFVIAGDPKINPHFTVLLSEVGKGDLTGFTDLSENLTTFVSAATGAKDYVYIGLNMHDAHDPSVNPRMNGAASNADFDEFVTDLVKGATQNKVPTHFINSLGAIVETLRTTVVQK